MKSIDYYLGKDIELKLERPNRPSSPFHSNKSVPPEIAEDYSKKLLEYNQKMIWYEENKASLDKIRSERRNEFYEDLYVEHSEYSREQVDLALAYSHEIKDAGISQTTIDTVDELLELHANLILLGEK